MPPDLALHYGPFLASVHSAPGLFLPLTQRRLLRAERPLQPTHTLTIDSSLLQPRNAAAKVPLVGPGWRAQVGPDQARLAIADPTPESLDYALAAIGVTWTVLSGGLVLHASSFVDRGRALLFAGRSGIGKTTLVERVGQPNVLSYDQTLLMPHPAGWLCHALYGLTPPAPAWRIHFLQRGDRTHRRPLTGARAAQRLLDNVFLHGASGTLRREVLATTARLVQDLPCYELSVSLHDLARDALVGPV